ncbi:ATP-dependent helicase [Faecalibaculum rodentium]|uniref:DNA 3'-5' helicase n=1 Tax=Faecalibaculum rodentium TaxID=1702221 RepID=A0A140DWD9_9FIRM|nr:UvrD-helicase domain-containing protein [Faecalibaculum rodentium]AMK54966.1 ATP-dependent DNA helicase PcrA [Faecalibaculum rodentium]
MSSVIDSLNAPQKEAALTLDKDVRIIAGAGSGKTRMLMARIASLVDNGILPWRILAITFTNKAAREMKERLQTLLQDAARDVRISTIHSLCVRILREDASAIGYPKNFTILDGDDQKSMLRTIYKELDMDRTTFPPSAVLGKISGWKTAGYSPEEAQDQTDGPEAKAYELYERQLEDMKAMDFDDLLLKTRHLLGTNQEVRDKWQNRLDYIHVDEFQDVDPVQYDIIRLLKRPDAFLCVVGDPDQTIYTWRGAAVDIILNFARDFPNTRTVILNENYRSSQTILDAANALIAHNHGRIEKDLFSSIESDRKIETFQAQDESQEPLQVARDITRARKEGLEYRDIAVLYRSNYLSRGIERVLGKLRIPYRIYGGIRFYERQEIKDMLSYLKLITEPDPEDPAQKSLDLAVMRVINVPRRGIGARTVEKLQKEAADRGLNLLEVLRDPQTVSGAAAKKFAPFVELVDEMKSLRASVPLDELMMRMAFDSGYMAMLKDTREEDREENIEELQADIRQALQENPDLTLEEYLQDLSLFTDRDEEAGNAVSLMTVHAAKGLEFEQVHIVGLNEGVFPSLRAMEEAGRDGLEEERRLMYVAMTRAKKALYLSWNSGYSFQLDRHKTPSRFIQEIPEDYVKQESTPLDNYPVHKSPQGQSRKSRGRAPKPTTRLRKGDHVEHTVYGAGVVTDVQKDIVSVAFGHPNGVRKLNMHHPSLQKVKG